MAVVQITIRGKNESGPAFKSTEGAVISLGSAMEKLQRQISFAGGTMLSWFAADKLIGGFKKGLEAVDNFQQSVVKTAAMITSLQGGTDVATNYAKAKEYAEGLNLALQQVDAKTTLNITSLQAITEELVKQGVVINYNNQSQVEGFTRLANAVAVYSNNGQWEAQLRQEVASLLRGEVNMQSQLATMLQRMVGGDLKQMVEQWKQSGTLMENLGKYLSGFGPAADDLSKSWGAVKSSLETSVNLILKAGFTDIVKDLVKWVDQINNYLKTHQDLVASKIRNAWEQVKGVFGLIMPVAKELLEHGKLFVEIWIGAKLLGGVTSLISQFKVLKDVIVAARNASIGLTAASAAGGAAAGGMATGAAVGGVSLATAGQVGLAGLLGYGFGSAFESTFIKGRIGEWVYDKLHPDAFKGGASGAGRDAAADAVIKKFMAGPGTSGAGYVPKLQLEDTPEQVKEKIELMNKELSAFKEIQDSKAKLVKGQSDIESATLKTRYEQGTIATKEYYSKEQETALNAAQKEFEAAEAFLRKEEELLRFIGAKKGEKSPEYLDETARNQKAIEVVQAAQLNYAKIFVDSEAKMKEALREREGEYRKIQISTLETAGQYVAAEQAKQAADQKSIEYLRLKKEAEDGIAGAITALAAIEQKRSIDLISAQNRENQARRGYEQEIAQMKADLEKLMGFDQEWIDANSKLSEGMIKLAELQDSLKLATAQGDQVAIAGLTNKIQLQEILLKKMREALNLQGQTKTDTGQIVGWNSNTPIYANSGTMFDNGQPVTPYESYNTASGSMSIASDPWFSNKYSSGVVFVDAQGSPITPRASGGPIVPGRAYLIGEKGPEILKVGNQGGTVIPNSKLDAAIGGTAIHLNGDLNFILPNVTNQSKASDLAKEIFPHLKQLARQTREGRI
ncbi:MAG: hypothetical protein VB050_04230 [Geobacteraceae bacterium]|nr:hypothetical protein [Geobacteraceae bacterium]